MHISWEQVKKIAAQAKLALSEDEIEPLANQLQEFLDYINVLEAISAEEEEPAKADKAATGREEVCCLRQEQVLALAPDSSQGLIRVPQVIEHGEN